MTQSKYVKYSAVRYLMTTSFLILRGVSVLNTAWYEHRYDLSQAQLSF
jgi:hypothetical protein